MWSVVSKRQQKRGPRNGREEQPPGSDAKEDAKSAGKNIKFGALAGSAVSRPDATLEFQKTKPVHLIERKFIKNKNWRL